MRALWDWIFLAACRSLGGLLCIRNNNPDQKPDFWFQNLESGLRTGSTGFLVGNLESVYGTGSGSGSETGCLVSSSSPDPELDPDPDPKPDFQFQNLKS